MKRVLSVIAALLMVTLCFAGCETADTASSSKPTDSVESKPTSYDVNIATLAGPTGMGMAYMLDSEDTINNYEYTVAGAPDQVTSKLLTGNFDIAAIPTNVAATLYNGSNGKIKLLALNTLGVLYVLEKGDSIKSIADLKGKKIYVSGQGAVPEFMLDYLLSANGIDPDKDVTIDFTYSTHADLVAFAASGAADVVLLPEPTVTSLLSQNSDMKVALDLNKVWDETVKGTDYEGTVISMGCVAVNTEFANKHPEAVKNFLVDYENSVNKVNGDFTAASEKIAELGIVPKAPVALKALPRCNIVFVSGKEMVEQVKGFYDVLFNANPKSVGGKLPDEAFYYAG